MTNYLTVIRFYYPGEPNPVFAVPEVEINDLGGSAVTNGVELGLANILLDFNEMLHDKKTEEMFAAATGEDNGTYDRLCGDRRTIRENIGEINYVREQIIRLRSN